MSGTQESLQKSFNKFLRKKGIIDKKTVAQKGSRVEVDFSELCTLRIPKTAYGYISGFVKGSRGPAALVAFADEFVHKAISAGEWYASVLGYRLKQTPKTQKEREKRAKTHSFPIDWAFVLKVENGPYDVEGMLTSFNAEIRKLAKAIFERGESNEFGS